MVCRDNFFNVKYAIDMAELTDSYMKGFVETCFKAGVHEKQAAAMLDLVIGSSAAMEKSAAGGAIGAFKNLATGVGQLVRGVGNTALGAGKIVIGAPLKLAVKPAFKTGKFIHRNAMVEPIKHYVKDKNYLAALMHAGVLGSIPVGGFAAFQNWRANSDSKVADAINDYFGDPDLFVFDGTPDYKDISTSRYGYGSNSLSNYNDNDSPFNVPGTSSYTPGERKLRGGSGSTEMLVPDRVKPLMDRHRELRTSIDNLKRSRMSSNSATERSRVNSDNVRELQEELDDLTLQIERELDEHNRQVSINERHIAQRKANAVRDLSRAQRKDVYQAGIDLGDDTWYGRAGNDLLEITGIRDTDAEAAARAAELRDLEQAAREVDNLRAGNRVDVQAILNMLNN